jgi:hypothetical protein
MGWVVWKWIVLPSAPQLEHVLVIVVHPQCGSGMELPVCLLFFLLLLLLLLQVALDIPACVTVAITQWTPPLYTPLFICYLSEVGQQ